MFQDARFEIVADQIVLGTLPERFDRCVFMRGVAQCDQCGIGCALADSGQRGDAPISRGNVQQHRLNQAAREVREALSQSLSRFDFEADAPRLRQQVANRPAKVGVAFDQQDLDRRLTH